MNRAHPFVVAFCRSTRWSMSTGLMQSQPGCSPVNPFLGMTGWEAAPPSPEPISRHDAPARCLWNTDRSCVSELRWINKRQSFWPAAVRRTPCRSRSLAEPAPRLNISSARTLRRCVSSAVVIWGVCRPRDDPQPLAWSLGAAISSRRTPASRTAIRSASLPARHRRERD